MHGKEIIKEVLDKGYYLEDYDAHVGKPLITFLMCYRVMHELQAGNDICTFFETVNYHIPEHDMHKLEFIVKLDCDDAIAMHELILKDSLRKRFPNIKIRYIIFARWSGRATLYLNYMTMFSKRNPHSKLVGFVTGDCIFNRNFIPDLEDLLDHRYFIYVSQYDPSKLEYALRWRDLHYWAEGGLTEPFPILTANLIEFAGGMGWQSNIDNWIALLGVIVYHEHRVCLFRKAKDIHINFNHTKTQQFDINPIPTDFNSDMYTSISQRPMNRYYFNLVEQQARNIYLNIKAQL